MAAERSERATYRLSLRCNNHCVFCAQEGLDDARNAVTDFTSALTELRARADEITFVGGEPTIDPRLPDAISTARSVGFAKVGIQTNARRLATPAFTASLLSAGLTDVHVSIHGAQPAVHDYHTDSPGSFVQTLAGMAAARAAALPVAVTTVVTRSNFRSLAPMPALLQSRGVAAWLLAIPHAGGRAANGFDRVVPRLGLALPFALHALETARALKLPAAIAGAPSCALGPFASLGLETAPRAYTATCESCAARTRCPGLDPIYLQRFSGDELSALNDAPPAVTMAPTLSRMFVGVGEIAPPAGPRTRERVALPVLGKVQPARREVAAGTQRRSGDALREILPGLFERPDE